ncbi:MAG: lyase family protein [Bacteroidetes bacterium]|nr:lyase family protein [Bacteroidota bacterium]
MTTRKEHDLIGDMAIPARARYGIHAARAKANFPDQTIFHREWYKAMGLVKKACYQTAESYESAMVEKYGKHPVPGIPANPSGPHFAYLIHAAAEVAEGEHFESFIVPALSGGAGTSINMNVNEIIANVALQNMGEKPGRYDVIDPIEHANIFQSTNDVVPTALKVAVMFLLQDLEKAINALRFVVEQVETAHQNDLRIGYTQMQEAVPTSFGKLFSTYSEALSRDWWRVSKCFERIKMVNLGGSAIGTGLAVPRYFIMEAIGHLQQLTGLPVTRSENLADATSNLDSYVEVHATIKAHAVNLEKMVSDIRLLASDLTSTAFKDPEDPSIVARQSSLMIPQCQAGSSIMPGKINPVIPEFVISAAHRVYANDQLITSLCAQGCLELNAYLPAIGHALLDSIKLLIACNSTVQKNLVEGLLVFPAPSKAMLFRSPSITTALLPVMGYHQASELAGFMKINGVDIFEANRNLKLISGEKLQSLLTPDNLLKLGYTSGDLAD